MYRAANALATLCLALGAAACGDSPGAGAAPPAGGTVTATDDTGRELRLGRPARRVVSLLPAGTETLFALGAGDAVVGRTRYDQDPHLAHLPSVGGGLDPSLEALVALRPDLVVAWEPEGGGSKLRPRLEALGIPVFAIQTRDTADVFRNIRNLGHLTGRDAAADSLAASVRARLDAVRASVSWERRPRVLYVIALDPPIVAGGGDFLAELVRVAGGDPIVIPGTPQGLSPQVSLEVLLRQEPDVVILPVRDDSSATRARLLREPGWRDLRAVREGRIAHVPVDTVHRPGPAIARGAELVHRALAGVWSGR